MDNGSADYMKGTEILSERPDSQFTTSTNIVCLNFKVPLRIRQQFKVYAARHNMTMTELLLRLLNDSLTLDVQSPAQAALPNKEIKK